MSNFSCILHKLRKIKKLPRPITVVAADLKPQPKSNRIHGAVKFSQAIMMRKNGATEQQWKKFSHLRKKSELKNIAPTELMASKSIAFITDKNLRDKILHKKGTPVKLVIDRIKSDINDKAHAKDFSPRV